MTELIKGIVEALCRLSQGLIVVFLQYLTIGITDNSFTPSMDTFLSEEGGIISQSIYQDINTGFQYVSIGLTVIIIVVHVLCFFLAAATELRDSIGQLVFRFFICIMAAFYLTPFLNICMNFGREIFNEAFSAPITMLRNETSPRWVFEMDDINFLEDPVMNTLIFEIFKLLLWIIFFGIVAYNFAKLCIELIKRYISMCILQMASPLAASFYATAESQNVCFAYIKMFCVEVGVVAFTRLWIFFSMYVMANVVCTFTNMCIMIAIIQFGVNIERQLKEMGLTTANLGSALLDNVAATGATMVMMISHTKTSTGESLINLGGATGNMGLVTIGSALTHKPMSVEGKTRTMNESAGAAIRAAFTQNKASSNLTGSQKKAMDDAVRGNGLFRNQALQNMLKDLNSAGYQEAMQHIAGAEFGRLSKAIGDPNSTLTPINYSQNNGLGFEYKSGMNGIKRNGFISDTPKAGNGMTSIPLTLDNGKTVYANFEPMTMNDIHNSGVEAFYNSADEKLGDGMTSMEMDTGMRLSQFMYSGDSDASHYAAVPNNTGGLDIMYNNDGISSMNLNDSDIIGAVTKNGYNLKTTDYKWGNGMTSPESDIYETLTTGAWSNMGLSDINKNDIKYDTSTGAVNFSATDWTGARNGYVAMPSVHVQDKVTESNTKTDSTHGSYTFTKAKNTSNSFEPKSTGGDSRSTNVQERVIGKDLNAGNSSAFTKAENTSNNSIENTFNMDGGKNAKKVVNDMEAGRELPFDEAFDLIAEVVKNNEREV